MSQNEATTTRLPDSPVSIYERFTSLYDLMFRFNGYARSIERYLRDNPLPLAAGARVLDAGCGTGLLTLALLRVLKRPAEITAVDLSGRSLQTARRTSISEALLASIVSSPFWYVTTAWPASDRGSAAGGSLGAFTFICSCTRESCALHRGGSQSKLATAAITVNCERMDNI